jgi:predicted transcriptional regulator
MPKQTKRIKNKTKNITRSRTRRYYGGAIEEANINQSKGIFDVIGDTLSNYTSKVVNYAKDKGLRLAGLEPIKKTDESSVVDNSNQNNSTNNIDNNINKISDAASGLVSGAKEIGSDIVNVFDKGSAAVIENINTILENPKIEASVSEAASETAEIGEKLLEKFNEKISTPELKAEAKEALENAADYAEIAVDAIDKPLNKAIDQLNEDGAKAASGIATGVIKVGTDAMAAVPGLGAVIELGKMANDASAAAGDVVEATSKAASTVSKVVEDTTENIEEGINKLEQEKKLEESMKGGMAKLKEINKDGTKIYNRVNSSIHFFENPLQNKKGGYKTKRRFFKNKPKTKRVRFAI